MPTFQTEECFHVESFINFIVSLVKLFINIPLSILIFGLSRNLTGTFNEVILKTNCWKAAHES